ncbi:MAG: HEPN domain-containing protein [Candidatus Aenigmarchaeota archaeon]|nr:HEPN domain-containing protein [Candidatus Aenigmarchaeota archaeon]
MNKVKWCLNVKRGVKLIKPNENLSKSYIKKAEDSLISMRANLREGITDWASSAAYYARYHILYALFMKCGIKSEIHECTLEIAKVVFSEFIQASRIKQLEKAKIQRINLQYYTDRLVEKNELDQNMETAGDFVMELKGIIESFDEERIEVIRRKIRDFM